MLAVGRWLLSSSVLCVFGLLTSGVCIALAGGNIEGAADHAAQEVVRERKRAIFTIPAQSSAGEGDACRCAAAFCSFLC